jgi:hypothetical protein
MVELVVSIRLVGVKRANNVPSFRAYARLDPF